MKDLHNNIFFRFVTSYKTYSFFKNALDVYISHKNAKHLQGLIHFNELIGIILKYNPAFFENNSTLYVFLIRIAVLCDRYKDVHLKHAFLKMSLTSMDSLIKAYDHYGLPTYNRYVTATEWEDGMRQRAHTDDLFLFYLEQGINNAGQVATRSSHVNLMPMSASDSHAQSQGIRIAMIRDCQPGRRRYLNFPREHQFSSISTRLKKDCSSLVIMPYLSMFSAAIWLNLLEWDSSFELLSFNLIRGNKSFRALSDSMRQFRIDQDVLRLFIIRMLIDLESLDLNINTEMNLGFSYVCYLLRQSGYVDAIIIYILKLPYSLTFDSGNFQQRLSDIPELVNQLSTGLTADPASPQFLTCELYTKIIEKKFTNYVQEKQVVMDPIAELASKEMLVQTTNRLPMQDPLVITFSVNLPEKYSPITLYKLLKSKKVKYAKLDEYSDNVNKYMSQLNATKLVTIDSSITPTGPTIQDLKNMAADNTVKTEIRSIKDIIEFSEASVTAQRLGSLVINPLISVEPKDYIKLIDDRFPKHFHFLSLITVRRNKDALEISQILYDSNDLSNPEAIKIDGTYQFKPNCVKVLICPIGLNIDFANQATYMSLSKIVSSKSCSNELITMFKKINCFIQILYHRQFVKFKIKSASIMQIILDIDMVINVAKLNLVACNSADMQVIAAELISLFDIVELTELNPKIEQLIDLCMTIREMNLFKGPDLDIRNSKAETVLDYRSFKNNKIMQGLTGIAGEYLGAVVHIMQNIRLYQFKVDEDVMQNKMIYNGKRTVKIQESVKDIHWCFSKVKEAGMPISNVPSIGGSMLGKVNLDRFAF